MATVDLSDYGYVNARVRGMRSHLLTKEFFMQLVEADSFETLNSLLEQTIYRREVNEAVLLDALRPDYDMALSLNMIAAFRKILDATGGEAHRLTTVMMSRYDLLNVKTVIRGKRGNATPSEIISLLVPVGAIRMDVLEQMAQQREIRDVINYMTAQQMSFAPPLVAAYPDFLKKEQDLAVLETALDRYYYARTMESLRGKDKNVEMVREMISDEIDMRNVSTLVRIRGIKLEDEDVEKLRVPGGLLTEGQFLELHRLGDIVQMVGEYPEPRYRKLLEKALSEYQEVDVAAFDRELEHELVRRGMAMSNVDVLGIGVIIGYMWAKQNEIINLRITLKGKLMGQPQADIKRNLFFVEREAAEAA